MIYLLLFLEFFKIGLFSFGGGYATIPFLYHISENCHWYSLQELTHMTAIASITPGPIGINVATYAGLKTAGLLGSFVASISEVIPSFFLVIIVSKLLKRYSENFYVMSLIETLKPISCALLISVCIALLKSNLADFKALLLLLLLIFLSIKTKKDPAIYMLISGIAGIFLYNG